MDLAGLSLIKIDENSVIKRFDCGDEDLNSFLLTKSIFYLKELLATTYLLENAEETIAFFSIFNDSIRIEESEFASKNALRRLLSEIVSHPKRHLRNFPAIKIGRLGVSKNIQKSGLGRSILSYILDLAITQNKSCACKFIVVDAYEQSLGFYEKLNFSYYTEKDKGEDTRQMFLDLTPYTNTALNI